MEKESLSNLELASVSTRPPRAGQFHGNRSQSESLDLKSLGCVESFSCRFEQKEKCGLPYFSIGACSIRNVLWSRAPGTMARYAFECAATPAAQVMRQRLFPGEVSLCCITQAPRGRIGHGNETEGNRRAGLCGRVKSHRSCTRARTQAYSFQNPVKAAWIAVSFDFFFFT